MKQHLILIPRLAAIALATGGLCCGSIAFGQAKAPETPNEPTRVGSMAGTGAKPSKADLAKMAAEKAAKAGTTKPADAKAGTAKPAAAQLDAQDRDFMMQAANGCMDQVAMGKMAAKQGKSADVKKIGKMMVSEHNKANKELMALAKKKGVTLAANHQAEKLAGPDFDAAYLAEVAKGHQAMIAACEKEAKKGKDVDAKSWASKMVPALKSHLKMVQDAQKGMKKAG